MAPLMKLTAISPSFIASTSQGIHHPPIIITYLASN
jgi:hypothetical protein